MALSKPPDSDLQRRQLLTGWIKTLIFIFFVYSILLPIGFIILNGLGYPIHATTYGLMTKSLLTPIGLTLVALFILNFAVIYGLWFGKKWAVSLGITDAVIGLALNIIVPLQYVLGYSKLMTFSFEFIFLIPLLWWLINVKDKWDMKPLPSD